MLEKLLWVMPQPNVLYHNTLCHAETWRAPHVFAGRGAGLGQPIFGGMLFAEKWSSPRSARERSRCLCLAAKLESAPTMVFAATALHFPE